MAWCLVLFGGDPREHHDGIQPLPLTVALADPALIRSNFAGQPAPHVESIDMALSRRE